MIETAIAVYEPDTHDATDDSELAERLVARLGGRITGTYGDRPEDDARGDPGWHAEFPLAYEEGESVTIDGWEVVFG